MIDFVPSPSTTNASVCPPASNTNAGSPRDVVDRPAAGRGQQPRGRERLGQRVALAGVERLVVDAGGTVRGAAWRLLIGHARRLIARAADSLRGWRRPGVDGVDQSVGQEWTGSLLCMWSR